ncbi:MAG: radical SAM protein [bacterium]|jgi:wyosine [tRNA(Phe)-imidazoG37] synthetase (radical SAM superfamily)
MPDKDVPAAIVFGPIPSRRLGRSLGVNNIPPKVCTYSCVYCQIGVTGRIAMERGAFYEPQRIYEEVARRVDTFRPLGEGIDYITFVPDGEPTLDINLGEEIGLIKSLGIRIAVITNGTLLSLPEVRRGLAKADWVSVKIDAATTEVWRRLNRPHKGLSLDTIRGGILEFAGGFSGDLMTETMLLEGYNDSEKEIKGIASFVERIGPGKAYLGVPTRPPALPSVRPAPPEAINLAYQAVTGAGIPTELMVGYSGDPFSSTGNARADILSISAVHPMPEAGVRDLLARSGEGWDVVKNLITEGLLLEVEYLGEKHYLRNFNQKIG